MEKLNRAGSDRLGTDSSTCEQHNGQTALETLTVRSTADAFLQLGICLLTHTWAQGSQVPFGGARGDLQGAVLGQPQGVWGARPVWYS